MPKPKRSLPPQPSNELCVWGVDPSIGWRWYPSTGWERVCGRHIGGDYVPDSAKTERQALWPK
jgi:hypothetical protein